MTPKNSARDDGAPDAADDVVSDSLDYDDDAAAYP